MTKYYATSVAVVVAAIPTYLLRLNFFGLPTNVFEALVLVLVIVGLLLPDVRSVWRTAELDLPRPVIYFVGLFVAAALLSAIISDVPRVSFGIFKSWIIIPLLLGWLVYAELRITNYELRITHALTLSGVIVSLLSLTQFTWGERLAGIYDVSNSLALYLAPLIVLAVARGKGVIYGMAAFLMSLILLLTQSIAGIAVTVTVISAVLIHNAVTFPHFEMWKGRRLAQTATVIIVLLGGAAWYLSTAGRLAYSTSLFITGEPNSLSVRLQLWDIAWDLIKERHLLGIGLGQFEPAYQQKLHERFASYSLLTTNYSLRTPPLREFVYRDPHNWLLSFWLNTGLLGLVSFVGLHGWLVFWSLKNWSLIGHWDLVIGILGALLVLLLFGLVDTIYWKNDLAALHWVLLGLILGSGRGREH
jgi:O-antigen ligase